MNVIVHLVSSLHEIVDVEPFVYVTSEISEELDTEECKSTDLGG